MAANREDTVLVEVRDALAGELRSRRRQQGLTQAELAKLLGSSQSRVAKMEASEPGVTLDLLVKALAVLGETRMDIAKAIIRPMPPRPS